MSRKPTPAPRSAAKSKPPGRKVSKTVESSVITNHRRRGEVPLQPKLRKTPARAEAPKPNGKQLKGKDTSFQGANRRKENLRAEREHISLEAVQAARATGMLPHEWMLAVMRGEQINHYAYDADTQEIVEVIVLPTFADRIECAKSCAPYFANRLPNKPVEGGKHSDPSKQPGVMEVPLAASMEKWVQIAAPSQAHLKKEVTK